MAFFSIFSIAKAGLRWALVPKKGHMICQDVALAKKKRGELSRCRHGGPNYRWRLQLLWPRVCCRRKIGTKEVKSSLAETIERWKSKGRLFFTAPGKAEPLTTRNPTVHCDPSSKIVSTGWLSKVGRSWFQRKRPTYSDSKLDCISWGPFSEIISSCLTKLPLVESPTF